MRGVARILTAALMLTLLESSALAHSGHAHEDQTIALQVENTRTLVGGMEVTLDVPPAIVGGRTLVPLRFIGEALGARIGWDPDDRRVTYTKGSLTLELWIDQQRAVLNGAEELLDVAPQIINGRTVVPVRFISEKLQANVEWLEASRTVLITTPGGEAPIASGQITLRMSGLAFKPAAGTIKKGSTVTWVNDDTAPHTVTASNGAFDSDLIAIGGSWSHTFNEVGAVEYGCDLHVGMKAVLKVVD